MEVTIYLVFDMAESLSEKNIDVINKEQGENYPYGLSYKNLYDSREDLGSQRGYFKYINNIFNCWVLPSLKGSISMDGTDENIVIEVTEDVYKRDYLPTFDKEEIEL